jgi:hypothetical protein
MSIAEGFRANAAKERAAALRESLPHRRAMYERSAMQWDEMAEKAEEHDRRATENAAAKAEREKSVA